MSDLKFELFPPPFVFPGRNSIPSPRTWPGITSASTAAVQALLKENHEKHHIFFNDRGFHNHIAHAALAQWSLGADETIIQSAYKHSSKHQRSVFPSPGQINSENWTKHLADENYYQAYCTFFTEEVKEKGVDATVETYIFSPSANVIPGLKVEEQPAMLNRFHAGLLHSSIHTGYGLEFRIPGLVVEGLAQAAVHPADGAAKFTSNDFEPDAGLAARLSRSVGLDDIQTNGVHAFTILSRVINDERLSYVRRPEDVSVFEDVTAKFGDIIKNYVNQWSVEGPIEDKVEELCWVNTLIYACAGYSYIKTGGHFNADFFHAHLVTSSLFLGTIASHLNQRSQTLLLRSYFAVSLTWYISRNRPILGVGEFFNDAETLYPVPPGPHPTPHKAALPSPSSPRATTPNPWLAILQSSIVHPDDHVTKLQRALAHFAEIYGTRPAGYFANTELNDAAKIEGSLFTRAAGLSAARLGWVREGSPPLPSSWDRKGFPPAGASIAPVGK